MLTGADLGFRFGGGGGGGGKRVKIFPFVWGKIENYPIFFGSGGGKRPVCPPPLDPPLLAQAKTTSAACVLQSRGGLAVFEYDTSPHSIPKVARAEEEGQLEASFPGWANGWGGIGGRKARSSPPPRISRWTSGRTPTPTRTSSICSEPVHLAAPPLLHHGCRL